MKKILLIGTIAWFLISIATKGNCQYNLVPNPSFELYTTCPVSVGQILSLTNWTEALVNVSPDYLNSCNNVSTGLVGVPQNRFGFQHARTGQGYVGIVTAYDNASDSNATYREYVQIELLDSLKMGEEYTIEFYVSAADSCGKNSNNIGTYFSNIEIDTSIYPSPQLHLPFQPQFENPITNDLSDRIGWTLVTGNFIANGGEKYLIIGNFLPKSLTTTIQTGWGTFPPNMRTGYLYIDDVFVTLTDSLTSTHENNQNTGVTLSSISASEFVIDSKYLQINSYEVVNSIGQIIDKKSNINENYFNLNLQEFAKGIYIVKVNFKNQSSHILKIIKS